MSAIWTFITAHPTSFSLLGYYVAISFTGSLPAPKAESSMFYQFVFKFVNTLAGNLTRAYAAKVESSPNFQGAIDKQTQMAGVAPIIVQPVAAVASPQV